MKKLVIAFSVALLVMGMAGAAAPRAYAHTPRPLLSCYGSSQPCDSYPPPPISDCNGVQSTLESAPIKDHKGVRLGTLYLYESTFFSGCGSMWGALKIDSQFIVLSGMSMQENGHSDNSREGSLDTLPFEVSAGHWESTYMVDNEAVLPPYPCYTVGIDYYDEYAVHMSQEWLTNWCRY